MLFENEIALLGWVPDYPEVDDPDLKNSKVQVDGRLKQSEATNSVESLAESLKTLAETLAQTLEHVEFKPNNNSQSDISNKQEKISRQLKDIKEHIDQNVLDNLKIYDVFAHRLLKKDSSNKEVIKLKNALQYLFSDNKFRNIFYDEEIFEQEEFKGKYHSKWE